MSVEISDELAKKIGALITAADSHMQMWDYGASELAAGNTADTLRDALDELALHDPSDVATRHFVHSQEIRGVREG